MNKYQWSRPLSLVSVTLDQELLLLLPFFIVVCYFPSFLLQFFGLEFAMRLLPKQSTLCKWLSTFPFFLEQNSVTTLLWTGMMLGFVVFLKIFLYLKGRIYFDPFLDSMVSVTYTFLSLWVRSHSLLPSPPETVSEWVWGTPFVTITPPTFCH